MPYSEELKNLITRYPALACCEADIAAAFEVLRECFSGNHKLLIAGNGGSAADAEHIAGELLKRFKLPRPVTPEFVQRMAEVDPVRAEILAKNLERGLMAIPLVSHEALITAYLNDVGADSLYAQQVLGYACPGDVFLGITTSGNSENIIQAAVVAKASGMKVLLLTGGTGGKARPYADVTICVPEKETYKVQELHLPVYHCLCLMLESYFFGE